MARFLPLTVTDVRRETRDAVVVTLAPREADRAAFVFAAGQYLTFRKEFDGQELRRSYSLCAGADEGVLRVGVKRVEGGAFSTWAHGALAPGDVIEAMPPAGRFGVAFEPAAARHYLGFAAGSGITPVLSILKTALAREPKSRFTLVYANRQIASIMFREELEDLKNAYLGRLSVLHILKSDVQEIDLFAGRLDARKIDALLSGWIDLKSVDVAFICGPEALTQTLVERLKAHGLGDAQIKFELFGAAQPGRARERAAAPDGAQAQAEIDVTVTLDGTTRQFRHAQPDVSLLDAILAQNLDAPFSCKAGVCSTCRAKVLEGRVEMGANHALEDYEVEAGYVLTCQCHALSEKVVLTYDA